MRVRVDRERKEKERLEARGRLTRLVGDYWARRKEEVRGFRGFYFKVKY